MRVLLISSNIAVSPYPLYPLGCAMVAAALTRAGHEVRQFDFLHREKSVAALALETQGFAPDLIGISIRNIDNVNSMNEQWYIEGVKEIVTELRKVSNSKIVLGGPGFSLIPELILEEVGGDYGIVGEGEALMVALTHEIAKGTLPEAKLLGPETRLSGTEIPSAQYDRRIMEFYLNSGNIASIQTKRGCPHSCVYCSYPLLEGKTIRQRDPAAVVDDMERLHETHKVKYIFFTDSVFNDDEGAYLGLLEEMRRRQVSIPWTAFIKPSGLDDRILQLMKETGLAAVEIGSDAACDTTLKRMGKSFTFEEIRACNDLVVDHGIAAAHFFMFGGPGETRETVLEGIENILQLRQAVIFVYLGIRILPHTALARLAVKEGMISPDQGLLESAYYVSPQTDREWLEETLGQAFEGVNHCVFPPDSMDEKLKILHKLRYSGPLWDLLHGKKETVAD